MAWNMQVVAQAARGGAIFVEHRLVRRREGGREATKPLTFYSNSSKLAS